MTAGNNCGICNGAGKCAQCNGSGHDVQDAESMDCIDCGGTGKCSECKGKGKPLGWGSYLWESFSSLDYTQQRLLGAAAVGVIAATVLFWKVMLPLLALAIVVVLYRRVSRPKESL